MTENRIAIIGGTGLSELPGFEMTDKNSIETPYGEPSASLLMGRFEQHELVFLPRHGNPHRIPPHCINYRANLWALKELKVNSVLAVNAVGGISEDMDAGVVVIPDQLIDYTYGREHSYSDSCDVPLQHVDFTSPYDELLRQRLLDAVEQTDIPYIGEATYGATQGPRLETAAEIDRMAGDGCDLVGMTGMPEAVLARELDLPYAAVCLVVNRAAGRSEGIITMEEIERVMASGMQEVLLLLQRFLKL